MNMEKINLELAGKIVKGADSQAGNGYLQYYEKHRVYHPGWDINLGQGDADLGLPVTCPAKGKVIFVSTRDDNGGFGLHMVIKHEELGLYSHWLHLDACVVKEGDNITVGQYIANVGKTGTQYAHLHLEVFTEKHFSTMQKKAFRFYPAGYDKDWVARYYVDPALFVMKGMNIVQITASTWIATPKTNIVEIKLVKEKDNPKIYLKDKEGKYHWIEDEAVFTAFFGGFKGVIWEEVDKIPTEDKGFNIGAK